MSLEESLKRYVEKLGFEIAGAAPPPKYRRDPSADLRVHGLAKLRRHLRDLLCDG